MSTKQKTADALAGILQAKRGTADVAATALSVATPDETETVKHHPPAPLPSPPAVRIRKQEMPVPQARNGKSSDPEYRQCSVYLRKTTRKKVNRALDDAETGQDFSDLVQELLDKWLASRT